MTLPLRGYPDLVSQFLPAAGASDEVEDALARGKATGAWGA